MLGTLAEIKALNGYHNRLNAGLVQITKLDIYEIIALESEMRSEEIIAALNKIFEELFEIDPALLKPEALFVEDLGMDSLDAVDLIVAIEKEFGVRVKEEDARAIRTLGDIYNAVEKRFATSDPV